MIVFGKSESTAIVGTHLVVCKGLRETLRLRDDFRRIDRLLVEMVIARQAFTIGSMLRRIVDWEAECVPKR